ALDKDLLKRIEDIEKLDEATKQHLFFLIDNVIQTTRLKKLLINEKAPEVQGFHYSGKLKCRLTTKGILFR
ncbi:MAG TPA: hypothetical protein VD794_13660, partial [Flavisolibacter sp.]|nr:hypothetical protein [Flavisolibacter sp.]